LKNAEDEVRLTPTRNTSMTGAPPRKETTVWPNRRQTTELTTFRMQGHLADAQGAG
jgi:hypothetical protein